GPVTCNDDPPKIAAVAPPIAPETRPTAGGRPQATASATFRGNATAATVIPEIRSLPFEECRNVPIQSSRNRAKLERMPSWTGAAFERWGSRFFQELRKDVGQFDTASSYDANLLVRSCTILLLHSGHEPGKILH